MCIRDSIGIQPDWKIQTAGGDFLTNVVLTVIVQTVRIFVVNREPPVSYTHLDVDKRQVEHLAEQIAKLIQIDEIRKSRPRTDSVTAGLDLDRLGNHAENGSPVVKVSDIHIVQRLLLQKVLPYKQLGYGVADRRSSGENHTAAVMKLLQIAALHLLSLIHI